MSKQKKLIVGNWKCNGNRAADLALLQALLSKADSFHNDVAVCPPTPYLPLAQEILSDSAISWGAQDVSQFNDGAYTGDVSAAMLKDLGCKYVIIGHSERRNYYHEANEILIKKYNNAQAQGLTPIFCIGESKQERAKELTIQIVTHQLMALLDLPNYAEMLENCVIAYEPVWAIGTGLTATPEQAQAVHACLRKIIGKYNEKLAQKIKILYGGSMKADNAKELLAMPDIDGGLIGGASLNAEDFSRICQTHIK